MRCVVNLDLERLTRRGFTGEHMHPCVAGEAQRAEGARLQERWLKKKKNS